MPFSATACISVINCAAKSLIVRQPLQLTDPLESRETQRLNEDWHVVFWAWDWRGVESRRSARAARFLDPVIVLPVVDWDRFQRIIVPHYPSEDQRR